MTNNEKTSLYRFRPLNNHMIDELQKSYLYFSTIDALNDPMECFYKLFFNEKSDWYELLFKHFLITMHLVEIDSMLNGRETFKKDVVQRVFEADINKVTLKSLDFDDWIKANHKDIIDPIKEKEIWEKAFKIHLLKIYEKYGKFGQKNIETRINEYLKQIKRFILKDFLVCCFSNFSSSCNMQPLKDNEILMWSHYASGHSGICIEFKKDIVFKDANFQSKLEAKKVKYSDKDIKNLQFSTSFYISQGILQPRFEHLEKIYDDKYEAIYNTKRTAWNYENEYRCSILKKDLSNQKLKYDIECLESIIFGVNTPQDKQDEIKEIISKKTDKVAFYKIEIDEISAALRKCQIR